MGVLLAIISALMLWSLVIFIYNGNLDNQLRKNPVRTPIFVGSYLLLTLAIGLVGLILFIIGEFSWFVGIF